MLRWESDDEPLPERVIAGAELILGRRLPPGYRRLVQRFPGARPSADVDLDDGRERWLACVGVLLSLDPRRSENVFEAIASLAIDEQIPEEVVPIAQDGGGNMICLDYRAGDEPAVVYWQHELDGEEAFVPIEASFDAFLEILEREAR